MFTDLNKEFGLAWQSYTNKWSVITASQTFARLPIPRETRERFADANMRMFNQGILNVLQM